VQLYTLQPFVTLCVQSRVSQAHRVLEVACGAGTHSLVLAKSFLKRGAVLVACDFSEQMMVKTKAKFDDASEEYNMIAYNKHSIRTESLLPLGDHSFDLEQAITTLRSSETDRLVFGCQANNESLPFADATFDCYLANLSLMLVDNHHNQLLEAYRVCKKGANLAFTVWGRRENAWNFLIPDTILEKYGLMPKEKPAKTNFDIGMNPDALRKELVEIGFTDIKMWY
jgi:ubiquinone/menaquinone biosynthesis C-methylase UbiE